MFKYHFRKSLIFLPLFLIAIVGFVSCGGDNRYETDSKQLATELNKPKSDATKERDEKFMVQAQELNLQGVMLGKIGYQRATSDDVRNLARMIEDAYRATKSELASLAIRKSIAVPATASQKVMEMVDKLNEKDVAEFDAEYCNMILETQKDAIHTLEDYIDDGMGDPDIRAWATAALPQMRTHLTRITELEAQLKPVSEVIR